MTIFKRDEVEAVDAGAARPAVPQPSRREVRRMESGEVTVVGSGAKLEGTLVSAGSLRIDGNVKGQIQADGDVVLSASSQVDADIHAASVSIAGRLRGTIVVSGRAELKSGGRVEGDITSKSLVIEEGAAFDGRSIMERQGGRPASSPSAGPGGEQKAEVKVP